MAKISSITAREILDSKANPTIEVSMTLDDGTITSASCPSGTSVGKYEAREIRDNDEKHYMGMGVLNAIQTVEKTIAPALLGVDPTQQQVIDRKLIELDGTPDKVHLGANAILPVSVAAAKAGAQSLHIPLYVFLRSIIGNAQAAIKIPTPAFDIISGGKHASNSLDIQEFLIFPATSKSYTESLEIGVASYKSLKSVLEKSYLSTLTGDEGGFAPSLAINQDALSLISQAMEMANVRLGYDVFLGMDVAADSFYAEGHYKIKDRTQVMSGSDLSGYYQELITKFHIIYLEDPFSEDDWDSWSHEFPKLSENTIITGDDLIATNPLRLQMALEKKTVGGIVIKPNQIGTVMETIAVVALARQSGLKIIVSHRSGETDDDFIADFAVAVGAEYVKFGAPARGERVAKYNRLLAIDQQIKQG